jgi:NTE family protein
VGRVRAPRRRLPGLLLQAGLRVVLGRRALLSAIELLGRALPTGLFSPAPLEAQIRRLLSAPGRSNDFPPAVKRKLVLVATDLDSGEAAPFGQPGWDHVPISQAAAASAALPGLFPPVAIGGRWYVDGALKKTLHASVLLDMGLDLLICLNPLVPFDATHARHRVMASGDPRIPKLVAGGLPVVLSQTFRSLIHSRLELGLKRYERSAPGTDIVLFEPDHHDPEMFLANTFGYAQRRALGRARLPAHPRRPALAPQHAGAAAGAPRHPLERRRARRHTAQAAGPRQATPAHARRTHAAAAGRGAERSGPGTGRARGLTATVRLQRTADSTRPSPRVPVSRPARLDPLRVGRPRRHPAAAAQSR